MKLGLVFLFLLTLLGLTACSQYGPEQLKGWEKIKQGALLIDVRTAQEFQQGHLSDALNIDYEQTNKIAQSIGSNKHRLVVLYCRSGRRASVAMKALNNMGYDNIYNAQAFKKMQAALIESQQ